MGENGAGKSTLIKILAGAQSADRGQILIDGEPVDLATPAEARRAGVAVIYQELNLIPALSVRENLFLGREATRGGMLRAADERRAARELFARLNIAIDPEIRCGALTIAQQQLVEIAKAIALSARIIVMDEPTAALTSRESERLFTIIDDLRRRGAGIIYVSHRMDEVFRVADRITVMRDGSWVETRPTREMSRERLIELMVGRKLENEFPKERASIGEEMLRVTDLRREPAVRRSFVHGSPGRGAGHHGAGGGGANGSGATGLWR